MNQSPGARTGRADQHRPLLTVGRIGTYSRWVTGALAVVAAAAAALLHGWPAHSTQIDRANLQLAAALATRHAQANDGWHTAVTLAQADRNAARVSAHAEEAPQVKVALEQVRTLVRAPDAYPDPPLQWPVEGPVVSGFGLRAWPEFGRVHPGIDLVNLPGTPIGAAADGSVVSVRGDLLQGNSVVIDHGPLDPHPGRWTTVYGHLEEITVVEGDTVRVGDEVGTLGNTGQQSTGPHLHFEVRIENQPVDPRRWLP